MQIQSYIATTILLTILLILILMMNHLTVAESNTYLNHAYNKIKPI